jgi:cation transport ATPase
MPTHSPVAAPTTVERVAEDATLPRRSGLSAVTVNEAPHRSLRWRGTNVVPAAAVVALAVGGILRITGTSDGATVVLMTGLVLTGLPLVWRTAKEVLKGHFATDVVAMLAVVVAVVMGQQIAGLVIVLMQSGGEALEGYAEGRASAAVRALEEDAPRIAHRVSDAGQTEDVGVADILVGDVLLVRPGEMLPCDGVVTEGTSHVDTARISGEPIPVRATEGTRLSSGSLNIDGPLTMRASATAGASQYARVVELVRSAQASKAPLQRLADRYAIWFTPATLIVCAIAYWWSGDWSRVLAVLVVATPCPLILATPVAIIGGVNRAARIHVIVRDGGALEQLAQVTTAVFDKTGTLTVGAPVVSRIVAPLGIPERELLRLAAALEHRSGHQMAGSVVRAAEEAGLTIADATDVIEEPGRGVKGMVDGRSVCVGARGFADECMRSPEVPVTAAVAQPSGHMSWWMGGCVVPSSSRTRCGRDSPHSLPTSRNSACDGRCCCLATARRIRSMWRRRSASRRRTVSCCRATRWPSSTSS